MRYKLLGDSGLRVSELCLGAMTFGQDDHNFCAPKAESRKMFDAFVEAGGNFIDTANGYMKGVSEQFVGEFVGAERDRFVIATKFTLNMSPGDPNDGGNHRKNLVRSLEASLKRLNTEYVDLLWLHMWDFTTPADEVMRALDDLVRAGKVFHVGVSDTPAWIVSQANTLAELRGWSPFVALQVEYSLVERAPERELLPMARALGLAVTPWSVLGGGVLTGKYGRRKVAKKPRKVADYRRWRPEFPLSAEYVNERTLCIAEAVTETAAEAGCTPAQVALAWARAQDARIVPILGARTAAQLKDNLGCLAVALEPAQLERLDAASRIELGFPHEFLATERLDVAVFGGLAARIDGAVRGR